MTDQELKDIVAAVVAELEKSGVDFDYKAEQAKDDDLVFVIRGTAPNYQGVTVTWKGLLDIITAQATQAKNDAETAKNTANTILEQVQSKGTEITNFVATSKAELETQKNESVNAVKSVYQTDLNELKGDLAQQTRNIWDEKWELGYLYNGNKIANSDSIIRIRSKNYIPVSASTDYYISNCGSINCGFYVCWYDSSNAFISPAVQTSKAQKITSPDNAAYMLFCTNINNYGTVYNNDIIFCLDSSDNKTVYIPHVSANDRVLAEQISFIKEGIQTNTSTLSDIAVNTRNIWDEKWELGYLLTNGSDANSSTRIRSKGFIDVTENTAYYFLNSSNKNSGFFICWYNSAKNFISYNNVGKAVSVTSPSGAVYMRFCMAEVYGDSYTNDISICLDSNTNKETYIPHLTANDIEARKDIESLKNPNKILATNNIYYDGTSENIGHIGRWFNKNNMLYTVNNGSELYVRVVNATNVAITFSTNVDEAYFAYSIDGVTPIRTSIENNVLNIPNKKFHNVRIIIDAMSVDGSKKFTEENGIGISSITTDGEISGIIPKSKIIGFYGDSISEGINSLGGDRPALVSNCSAINSYPFVACEKVGAVTHRNAFGGSGAVSGGTFAVFSEAVEKLSSTRYMQNYHMDMIVINHGYNDDSIASDTFISAYKNALNEIIILHPSIPIIILVPFAQTKRTELLSIYNDYKDNENIYLCETNGWGLVTTDGSHPSVESAITLGNKLAEWLLSTFGKDWFMN